MYKKILCATDFSARSAVALDHAIGLAADQSAQLHVVHAVEPAPITVHHGAMIAMLFPENLADEACAQLDMLLESRRGAGVPLTGHLETRRASDKVCELAENLEANLLVVGTHGRSGLKRMVMGSTAEKILRSASTPVLAIPPEDESASA